MAKYKFKGKEVPSRLQVVDRGYVLSSGQNVMRLDPAGNVKYHSYYPAAGQSGWIKVLSTAAVMATNAASASYAYHNAMANPGTTYHDTHDVMKSDTKIVCYQF